MKWSATEPLTMSTKRGDATELPRMEDPTELDRDQARGSSRLPRGYRAVISGGTGLVPHSAVPQGGLHFLPGPT
eukprot:m.79227 g.79227  ORF g.79227 m.79227 type:complete len:74 (-) comp10787_c0_seq1:1196-1417(-)